MDLSSTIFISDSLCAYYNHTITHDIDLENRFAGNPLLKDNLEDCDDSNKL